MKLSVKNGSYVVAVSGGVDSVVLLDMLIKQPQLNLTVAHFDHGIRSDSSEDRKFVEALAKKYGLQFEYSEGRLGKSAGEAAARYARYDFLETVRKKVEAAAIITAHHQDDVLETAIINMLRGTGRKGLSSLQEREGLVRPLLNIPKARILEYARANRLEWREDPTNRDTAYLRNYVRHQLLPRLSQPDKDKFIRLLAGIDITNAELDGLLKGFIITDGLERNWFNRLPHVVALEVMAAWLRQNELRGFDRRMLDRLVVAAKTGRAGKRFPIMQSRALQVGRDHLTLA